MLEALPFPFQSQSQRSACRVLLVLAATLTASGAQAEGLSVGGGAGASRGKVDCLASMPCDRSGAGFKLFAAYAFAPAFDARLSYFGGARFEGADVTPLGTEFGGRFRVAGVGLTAGYLWSFAPAWSLHGQAGLAAVRTRFDYADPFAGSVSKTTLQPMAGLSLGYSVAPALRVGLDYDVTRFEAHEARGSLRTLGLSAQVSF